ncbi:MAG: metal-dependent hydrolase [Wolinella sp.]
MLAKTHIAFSLALSCAPLYVASILGSEIFRDIDPVIYLGGVTFGALLPDIDEPESTIGRRFDTLSQIIHKLFGHRGATHSFLFPFIVASAGFLFAIAQGIALEAVVGLWLGVWLHFAGDMLTKSGIPLFLPFSQRNVALLPMALRFRTGGGVDLALGAINLSLFGYFSIALWGEKIAIKGFL